MFILLVVACQVSVFGQWQKEEVEQGGAILVIQVVLAFRSSMLNICCRILANVRCRVPHVLLIA